jgi:hypothetical protein
MFYVTEELKVRSKKYHWKFDNTILNLMVKQDWLRPVFSTGYGCKVFWRHKIQTGKFSNSNERLLKLTEMANFCVSYKNKRVVWTKQTGYF